MIMTKHNITRKVRTFLYLMGLLLFVNVSFAQKIPARPNPPRLVNDYADILTDKQERALEQKLVNYSDSTSTQICVVTVTSLGGTTSDDFAYQIGEKWGVGTKNNNGVVHRLSPSSACPNEPPNPLVIQFPPDFVPVSGLRPVLPDEVLCFCDADAGPGREDGGRRRRGKILSKV